MSFGFAARLAGPTRGWALALAAGLFLAACGGSGGGSGSGPGPGSGDTATQSYSSGRVSGLGSIIVNGVVYDESGARIVDADGNDLSGGVQLGMVVEVEGGAITPAAVVGELPTSVASLVRVTSAVRGPLEAVSGNTLTVLGQAVSVTSSTVFESGAPLSALALNDVVEVYGFVGRGGQIVATRIEREDDPNDPVTSFKLVGFIGSVDASAQTFTVGGTTISYAGVSDASAVTAGNFVRARLATTADAGVWTATQVAGRDATIQALQDSDEAKIEGVITDYPGTGTSFSVNGIPVDASSATFDDGTAADLAVGRRVEVEGSASGGILTAREVEFEFENDDDEDNSFELRGTVSSVTTTGEGSGSFVLRGLTVTYGPGTVYSDGTAANLVANARVEVQASLSADGTQLIADVIEFDDEGSEAGSDDVGDGGDADGGSEAGGAGELTG